ncbi:MAG: spore germination protein [Oscillospiraceae bacterium]
MKVKTLSANLKDNLVTIRSMCENSSDILIRQFHVQNQTVALISCSAMINDLNAYELVVGPLTQLTPEEAVTPQDVFRFLHEKTMLAMELNDIMETDMVFTFIMSGFLVVLVDGIAEGVALGLQGYKYRGVSEPSSEVNQSGSQEAFTEVAAVNVTMVRRRMKTSALKFEQMRIGKKSNTNVFLAYLTDTVDPRLVTDIKGRLAKIKLDVILEASYLRSFLESNQKSIFTTVRTTERPDTLCSKIAEGRVAIIIDGTPFALIVPSLFIENFHSVDDYCNKPYFATFVRIVKFLAFFITVFLPGLYISFVNFNPEIIPRSLLYNIAANQSIMPFSITMEAIIINCIYEIMREAGLRMPQSVGHAVSIVGSLVVGQAAVSAGLISAPMIMMVALTAISSYVLPSIYEPCAFLRLMFILLGGSFGLLGMAVGTIFVLVNITSISNFGVPFLSTISPFSLRASLRDVIYRASWKKQQEHPTKIQDLDGVHIAGRDGGRNRNE